MTNTIYQGLPSLTSIRLLDIKPGFPEDLIECNLIVIPSLHHECPTFEALSYVWGSAVRSRTIKCNGHQDFQITQNLHEALNHLRLPLRSRRVWADAICINQDDIDERNQQVRIMRDIYAAAFKVCVWLGKDSNGDAERASILMANIVQTCKANTQTRGRRWDDLTTELRFRYTGLPLLGRYGDIQADSAVTSSSDLDPVQLYWSALRSFFARSWFTRVWCVQEIVMSRDSIIMYGDSDIPWHVVEVTATWLNAQQMQQDFKVPSLIEGIDIFNALMMSEAANPDLRSKTLIGALRTFQDFHASDPRDNIYAISGIAEDYQLSSLIPIDYEKPVAHIYMKTVEAALEVQRDLFVLACVQHPEKFKVDPEFPSWTPRWDSMIPNDATMITSDIGVDDYEWKASGERGLEEFTIDVSKRTLHLPGAVYDTVDFVSEIMNYNDSDFSASSDKFSKVLPVWRKFIDPHTTSIPGISKISTFAMTLTCEQDIDYNHVMDFEDPEDRDEFLTDFLAYMMRLHDREEEREIKQAREKIVACDIGSDDGRGSNDAKPDTRPSSFPSDDGDPERYEIAASRMCDRRRFFVTTRGDMGLGPASTQQDDLIVVLFGGRVPFMLRKANPLCHSSQSSLSQAQMKNKGQCEYYLLGEAFIQNIMRGEVVDGPSEAKFVEEEFVIR